MEITFLTSNARKLSVANEVLSAYGIRAKRRPFDFREIQEISVEKVALDKARQAARIVKGDFIVSDDGLYIKSLGGFPGALLKPCMNALGDAKLALLVGKGMERGAEFVNCIVFYDSGRRRFTAFSTVTRGRIARKPKGTRETGWSIERIFMPEGYGKTIAEFDEAEWRPFWEEMKARLPYAKLGKRLSAGMKKRTSSR